MGNVSLVLAAAKSAKVAGSLLLAICTYESGGLKSVINPYDKGSPSYGICQLKLDTARMVGYHGTVRNLMDPEINSIYAARYLAYQQDRYGSKDWCKLAAAYNAGSYVKSKVVPGKPRNLKYVRRVQKYLPKDLKHRLSCDRDS